MIASAASDDPVVGVVAGRVLAGWSRVRPRRRSAGPAAGPPRGAAAAGDPAAGAADDVADLHAGQRGVELRLGRRQELEVEGVDADGVRPRVGSCLFRVMSRTFSSSGPSWASHLGDHVVDDLLLDLVEGRVQRGAGAVEATRSRLVRSAPITVVSTLLRSVTRWVLGGGLTGKLQQGDVLPTAADPDGAVDDVGRTLEHLPGRRCTVPRSPSPRRRAPCRRTGASVAGRAPRRSRR